MEERKILEKILDICKDYKIKWDPSFPLFIPEFFIKTNEFNIRIGVNDNYYINFRDKKMDEEFYLSATSLSKENGNLLIQCYEELSNKVKESKPYEAPSYGNYAGSHDNYVQDCH
jgi:hypothetical protein